MSVVIPSSFAPHLTPEEVWNIVNTLPVSFRDFAEMSYYYARLYDVLTGAIEGGAWDALTVNECVRTTLWRKLHEITVDAESVVGFNLSARYHYEEIDFPEFGNGQTHWPGVVSMSVKPVWASIDGYGPFAISAMAQTNVTINDVGNLKVVLADASIFENPADIQIRNGNNNDTYLPLNQSAYPKLTGDNWEIPIDVKRSNYDPAAPVNLQHRKHLILDVDPPVSIPAGSTLYPVYPGTNQIIPQAKPSQVLDNGKTRYTFYIYTLIHPAFRYETINLEQGQFWKLYPAIEFKLFSEAAAQAQVVWIMGGTEKTVNVTLKPTLGQDGVFSVVFDSTFLTDPYSIWSDMGCTAQDTPERIKLRFWYKTSPSRLPERFANQIPALRQAICHRVAAELPIQDCGCQVKSGFIFENQRRYDKVTMRPATGVEYRSADFVDSYGRLRYEDIVNSQVHMHRLVTL
jgi:hypothetical protein